MNVIAVVPTVTGAVVVHTQPVFWLTVPVFTNTKAPGISELGELKSKSAVRVRM